MWYTGSVNATSTYVMVSNAALRYSTVDKTELLGTDGPRGLGETRPCVLCEYSHAMGNSCGNIHKYWEVRERPVHILQERLMVCSLG